MYPDWREICARQNRLDATGLPELGICRDLFASQPDWPNEPPVSPDPLANILLHEPWGEFLGRLLVQTSYIALLIVWGLILCPLIGLIALAFAYMRDHWQSVARILLWTAIFFICLALAL
jgi:hypothetical protein